MGQSGFSSFYQLLNIRLMLQKMDFSDDWMAKMYRTETPQRGTTKSLFGIIQESLRKRTAKSVLSKTRRSDRFWPSTDSPLPMGASRNGNSLSNVNAYIGCKTENPLSLFIVEFQPRQYFSRRKSHKNDYFPSQICTFASDNSERSLVIQNSVN